MQIYIEDVIYYLELRLPTVYFDVEKYEFYSDIDRRSLLLCSVPAIQQRTIIMAYVQQSENEELKAFAKDYWNDWDNVFEETFHDLVEHFRLYEDFLVFRKKYLVAAAQRWCKENNIRYSLEHKLFDIARFTYLLCVLDQRDLPPEISQAIWANNIRWMPKKLSYELDQYISGNGNLPPAIMRYMLDKGFPAPPK